LGNAHPLHKPHHLLSQRNIFNINAFFAGRVLWYSYIETGVAKFTAEMVNGEVFNQNTVSCFLNGLKDSETLFEIAVALTQHPLLPYACDLCFSPCSKPYTLNPEGLGFKLQTLSPRGSAPQHAHPTHLNTLGGSRVEGLGFGT
jgi:hypothetical protein